MKNLDRNKSKATPEQIASLRKGRLQEENESLRKQSDRLYENIENLQQKVTKASEIIQKERSEKQKFLDKLHEAAASFKTLRGKLGNMTAQRNRAHRALKVTMDKLVKANQDIANIQEEQTQEFTDLVKDYQEMSAEQRRFLPAKLRHRLDQYERDYKE